MSTYNGAEFLAPQLDSILGQDLAEFRLLIRDDGSADGSLGIIRKYAENDGRIRVIADDVGNLGASVSFMALVERSNADFSMFADQDDVWLPGKISRSLALLNSLIDEHGNDKPLGVFTDLTVTDAELNVTHPSFWRYQKLDPEISADWKSLLAQNVVTGCTMMMNRAARAAILPFRLPEMMHDHWSAARIAKAGKLAYLNEPTVLYRQHSSNVEGARSFGPAYAVSKASGVTGWISFYRRAAGVFGDTTAAELSKRKLLLNLKRF